MTTATNLVLISRVRKLTLIAFGLALVYFSVQLIRYHYFLVTFPYPLEYREGALLLTTSLLLQGQNPYALQHMPTALNVYGINYHLFVYPFAKLWGATFIVHRSVSAAFLLLSCILYSEVLRRHEVGSIYRFSAVLILYASLLYRYTPLARPDSLGLFLFLLSIFITYLDHYSTRSLLISIALGIAAFYTKAYFVLAIPYVLIYLFLFVSKKKAVFYGFVSFLLMIIMAFITDTAFETYFISTLINHVNTAIDNLDWLGIQLGYFLIVNSGLVLIILLYLSLFTVDRLIDGSWQSFMPETVIPGLRKRVNVFGLERPLIEVNFPLTLHCLILSFFIFYFKLGRHSGNMMTYAYQLITPFFLLCVYSLFQLKFRSTRAAKFIKDHNYTLFMPCILLSLYLLYSSASFFKSSGEWLSLREWRRIEEITLSYENILNSPTLVFSLLEQNKMIYDAGQTEYFEYCHHSSGILDKWLPSNSDISKQWERFETSVRQGVSQQAFNAIVVASHEHRSYLDGFEEHYYLVETVEVRMFHTAQAILLEIWEPKSVNLE